MMRCTPTAPRLPFHRTEHGANQIVAMAKEMHADAAEEARKTKQSHGDEVYSKHALDQINESGLTNILNLALPDTRNLTEAQVKTVIDLTWAIRNATQADGARLENLLDA